MTALRVRKNHCPAHCVSICAPFFLTSLKFKMIDTIKIVLKSDHLFNIYSKAHSSAQQTCQQTRN